MARICEQPLFFVIVFLKLHSEYEKIGMQKQNMELDLTPPQHTDRVIPNAHA